MIECRGGKLRPHLRNKFSDVFRPYMAMMISRNDAIHTHFHFWQYSVCCPRNVVLDQLPESTRPRAVGSVGTFALEAYTYAVFSCCVACPLATRFDVMLIASNCKRSTRSPERFQGLAESRKEYTHEIIDSCGTFRVSALLTSRPSCSSARQPSPSIVNRA